MQITERHRKCIDRLFLTFSAYYGQVWRSQFKSDEFLTFAKNTWVEALMAFEEKHIEEATKLCRNKKDFPPTIPQFVDMCNLFKNKNNGLEPKERYQKAKPEVAQYNMQKIRQRLGMPASKFAMSN